MEEQNPLKNGLGQTLESEQTWFKKSTRFAREKTLKKLLQIKKRLERQKQKVY